MSKIVAGSASIQGALWGARPRDWAEIEEPKCAPLVLDVLAALAPSASTKLLDAGCGAGGGVVAASRTGATVTGFDASEGLLDVARGRSPAARFDVGDMETMPYGDREFDAVMAINSVFYCQDIARAVRELARVTRSGGRVAITAWGAPAECQMAVVFGALVAALPQRPAGGGPFALAEPGALDALFESGDLKVEQRGKTRCVFHWPSWDVALRGMQAAGPIQGAIRALGIERVTAVTREALAPFLRADGSIQLENTFIWGVGVKA